MDLGQTRAIDESQMDSLTAVYPREQQGARIVARRADAYEIQQLLSPKARPLTLVYTNVPHWERPRIHGTAVPCYKRRDLLRSAYQSMKLVVASEKHCQQGTFTTQKLCSRSLLGKQSAAYNFCGPPNKC